MPRKYTPRSLVPVELLSSQRVIPSENWECSRFVTWLDRQQQAKRVILYSHIANETRGPKQRLSNWRLGTRRGVPDYVIVLPGGQCVWVEMKRIERHDSHVSKDQREWIAALSPHAAVCYGSDAAIRFVTAYLGAI